MNNILNQLYNNSKWHHIILFILPCLLFLNTIKNDFVLNDQMVIVKNQFVNSGISGIPKILKNDTYKGFVNNDNSQIIPTGGRYRPFTLVLFAFIYQIFGANPMPFHVFNILSFALLCLIIYTTMKKLIQRNWPSVAVPVSFVGTLLFAFHPIHTEVVANIKGLDEIFSLLFSMLALNLLLLWDESKKSKWAWLALISFIMAVFSKESAIHFVVLIPASFLLLWNTTWAISFKRTIPVFIGAGIYLATRVSILGSLIQSSTSKDLFTNPFLKIQGNSIIEASFLEKSGMIFYSFFKYLQLLIFPHPLTHDYYPKQIPLDSLFTLIPMIGFITLGLLVFLYFKFRNQNSFISFLILLFVVPWFIISNYLFNIGTPMGERFMFTSSLALCMVIPFILFKYIPKYIPIASIFVATLLFAYSIKTVSRNLDWANDYQLLSTDIKVSTNSAKIFNSMANNRIEFFKQSYNPEVSKQAMADAMADLERTIEIYPRNLNGLYLLGNVSYMNKDYKKSVENYEAYLKLVPNNSDVIKNIQVAYRELGRQMAIKQIELPKAADYLFKSLKIKPNDPRVLEAIGIVYGSNEQFEESIDYFNQAIALDPTNANIVVNLGNTYYKKGDRITATECMKRAYSINPNLAETLAKVSKDFF